MTSLPVTAALDFRLRHAFDRGAIFGVLTLKFGRIRAIATGTRQMQRGRIDLQELPAFHTSTFYQNNIGQANGIYRSRYCCTNTRVGLAFRSRPPAAQIKQRPQNRISAMASTLPVHHDPL